jgi:hypothetical protein
MRTKETKTFKDKPRKRERERERERVLIHNIILAEDDPPILSTTTSLHP